MYNTQSSLGSILGLPRSMPCQKLKVDDVRHVFMRSSSHGLPIFTTQGGILLLQRDRRKNPRRRGDEVASPCKASTRAMHEGECSVLLPSSAGPSRRCKASPTSCRSEPDRRRQVFRPLSSMFERHGCYMPGERIKFSSSPRLQSRPTRPWSCSSTVRRVNASGGSKGTHDTA